MPRKNNRREEAAELDPERVIRGAAWVASGPDGSWYVRSISGAAAVKQYRCPGCDHEIAPGVAHVVVWPVEGGGKSWVGEQLEERGDIGWGGGRVADRRHWHTPCWNARARRRPR